MDTLWQDVRYGLRTLRGNPAFAAVAVATLALGIGANAAIFSLFDAVMLKQLPVRQPEQLVELLTVRTGEPFNAFSYQALEYFRSHNQSLSGIIASSYSRFYTVTEGSAPERVEGQYVTGDFFSVLGVGCVLGRPLAPEDDHFGAANAVAVLSYGYWRRRFGGDPGVVGRSIRIEDTSFKVAGIAPPEFFGVQVGRPVDFWIPLSMEPRLRKPSFTSSAGYKWLQLMGRLKPGLSLQQARADLEILFRHAVIEMEAALFEAPEARQQALGWSLRVEPAGSGLSRLRQQFSRPLQVLLAATGLVLLIACMNVANLLLARAAFRQREIAVRLSLGAGGLRLVRQLLTESLLLAGAGGVLGIILCLWGSEYLLGLMATGRNTVLLAVRPDARLLAFTFAVTLLTALLFGLLPAWRAAKADLAPALKAASGAGPSQRAQRSLGKILVVAQVALSLVLLMGASLLLRTLHNLRSIDLGFQLEGVLLVSLDPSHSGYSLDQTRRLFLELIERLEAVQGIRSASLSWITPITGGGTMRTVLIQDPKPMEARDVYLNWVGPKYFATLGTPLFAGREFVPQDAAEGKRVAIINQTLARRYFGAGDPIGKRVILDGAVREIVGVVGDAKYLELREVAPPTLYFNAFEEKSPGAEFVIRTGGDPMSSAGAVRQEIQRFARGVAVSKVTTLARHVDASIVQERLLATLSGFFGALAVLLAAIGLYGIMSYSVARRTNEMGIRMALGAQPGNVLWLVLQEALFLVLAGFAFGLPAALAAARMISNQLFGVTPGDPVAIFVAGVLMLAVASLAGFLPARRASRVDPMIALRYE